MRQGHSARLQGAPDVLVSGRVRRRPRPAAPVLQGFLRVLPQDLSKHPARGTGSHLQRPARQVPHRAPWQCRANGGPPANPGWNRVRLQGLSGATQARGRRLVDRGLLARRHEGRDLGWCGLRYPHQQRDDGADLERRYLQACGSRSGQGAGNLGRCRHVLQADPRQARDRRLRPRCPQERRQHALPLHAPALGLRRRRIRRSRSEPEL